MKTENFVKYTNAELRAIYNNVCALSSIELNSDTYKKKLALLPTEIVNWLSRPFDQTGGNLDTRTVRLTNLIKIEVFTRFMVDEVAKNAEERVAETLEKWDKEGLYTPGIELEFDVYKNRIKGQFVSQDGAIIKIHVISDDLSVRLPGETALVHKDFLIKRE